MRITDLKRKRREKQRAKARFVSVITTVAMVAAMFQMQIFAVEGNNATTGGGIGSVVTDEQLAPETEGDGEEMGKAPSPAADEEGETADPAIESAATDPEAEAAGGAETEVAIEGASTEGDAEGAEAKGETEDAPAEDADVSSPSEDSAASSETERDTGDESSPTEQVKTFVVAFELGDNAAATAVKPEDQKVPEGDFAQKPTPDPASAEGYEFDDWYLKDASGQIAETPFEFEDAAVDDDTVLTANFTEAASIPDTEPPLTAGDPTQQIKKSSMSPMADGWTVTFMNGDVTQETKTVNDGVAVVPAPNPDIPQNYASFLGWSTDPESFVPYDFDQLVTEDLTLYASFSDKYLISFKDAEGTVIYSIQVEGGDTIPQPVESILGKINPKSGQSFKYWYLEDDKDTPPADFYADSSVADDNLYLRPYLTDNYTVIFVSEGTQVAEPVVFVPVTGKGTVSAPVDPTRAGWNFTGWDVKDENGTRTAYDFDAKVTEDLVLYASWGAISEKAEYTIVVWMEKPNQHPENPNWEPTPGKASEYDYVTSVTIGGVTAGTLVSFDNSGAPLPSSVSGLFTTDAKLKYAKFQSADSKTIQGNGSTIINVYAQRIVYKWTLTIVNPNNNTQYRMTIGGILYDANSESPFFFRAKYEDKIENTFAYTYDTPIFGKSTRSGQNSQWGNWNETGDFDGWDLNPDPTNAPFSTPFYSPNLYVNTDMISQDGKQLSYNFDSTWSTRSPKYEYRYFATALAGDNDGIFLTYGGIRYELLEDHNATIHDHQDLTWSTNPIINYAKPIPGYTAPNGGYVDHVRYRLDDTTWTQDASGLYACFFYNRIPYNLTFNGNQPATTENEVKGLPAPKTVTILYGQKISVVAPKPNSPTLEGYTFTGWYKDPYCTEKFDFDAPMPNANVTVFAGWKGYTVTFWDTDDTDGEKIVSKDVSIAGYINLNDDDLKDAIDNEGEARGEGFAGWYWYPVPNTTIMIKFDPNIPVNGNYNLYARWKPDGFKVTYNSGNGDEKTGFPEDTETYAYGVDALVLDGKSVTTPKNPGEVFYGWLVSRNGVIDRSRVYNAGNVIQIKGDTTLVAQYCPATALIPYYVAFYYETSPGEYKSTSDSAIMRKSYPVGVEVSVTEGDKESKKTGYVLDESKNTLWSDNLAQTGTVLKVYFKLSKYTVTYVSNGAISGAAIVDASSPYIYNAKVTALPNTWEKTGYDFDGWKATYGGTDYEYDAGDEFNMPANNVTLTAQWTKKTNLTVTYVSNGAISGAAVVDINNPYEYDESVTALPNTWEKTGYDFDGWKASYDGTDHYYDADDEFSMPANNVTLTAQWTKKTNLTVTYVSNGAISGSAVVDINNPYEYDEPVTVLPNTWERTGYDFDGWKATYGGTDHDYDAGDEFNMPANNVTLIAQWTENDDIAITYVAGAGGSVSTTSETIAPTGVATGSTAIPAAGYHFVNWTDADDEEVSASATFTPVKVGGLNVEATYTANFAEDDDVTITYVAGAGGSVSATSETIAPATGVATGSIASPAAGYHFVNWTDADDEEVSDSATFTPAKIGGINVEATYTANFAEDDDVTITYIAGAGGSVSVASETVAPTTGVATGSTASPAAGYRFVNWTDANDEEVSSSATFTPAKVDGLNVEATYTANFEAVSITVTLDPNGQGGMVSPTTVVAAFDSPYGELPAPTRPGYGFIGWWTEAENGTLIMPDTVVSTPGDHVLYAHWVANPDTPYTIHYYLIDASGNIALANTVSRTGESGERVTADPRSYTGYTQAGDHPSANPSGVIAGDGSTVLSLYYRVNMYTITFVDSDGRVILAVQTPYGGSATPPASPSLLGYIFAGWSGAYMNITGDTTVTATYTSQQTPPSAPITSSVNTPVTPVTPVVNDTPVTNLNDNNNDDDVDDEDADDDDTDDDEDTGGGGAVGGAIAATAGGGGGGGAATDTTDATATDDVETETVAEIPDEPTPQASAPEPVTDIETVAPEQVPKAAGGSAAWALVNLVMTIVTGVVMLLLLITYFANRRKEDEDSNYEYSVKKRWPLRMLTIMTTIIAVILFVFTENMRLPMAFIDEYTLWHIAIAVATLILAILSAKKRERVETGAKRA